VRSAVDLGLASVLGPRQVNEDDGLALQFRIGTSQALLLGVCDGMGGEENGRLAAAEVARCLTNVPALFPLLDFQEEMAEPSQENLQGMARNWCRSAVARLEEVARERRLPGLTTTLAAALAWQGRLLVWWLGDSRVYRFREGCLERLTRDHSTVEGELDLTEEEALEHPARNRVARFLRPGTSFEPGVFFSDWREGDVLLAATDGVTGACRTAELEAFLAYNLAGRTSADRLCRELLDYLQANLHDNATVACAWSGTPRPFPGAALLDPQVFRLRGLRPEVVEAMNLERNAQTPPPWLASPAGLSGPTRLAAELAGPTPAHAAVCLECGRGCDDDEDCPDHGAATRWEGLYLEVADPEGRVTRRPIQTQHLLLGPSRSPNAVALSADPCLSPEHAELEFLGDGQVAIRDLGSDNGLWVRAEEVYLEDPAALEAGIELRLGQHRVALRHSRRARRQEPLRLRLQSRQGGGWELGVRPSPGRSVSPTPAPTSRKPDLWKRWFGLS
jgi:serine/threonine protein phosphatase PrpC